MWQTTVSRALIGHWYVLTATHGGQSACSADQANSFRKTSNQQNDLSFFLKAILKSPKPVIKYGFELNPQRHVRPLRVPCA